MVERHLAKVNVASSNLVFRSKQNDLQMQVVLLFIIIVLQESFFTNTQKKRKRVTGFKRMTLPKIRFCKIVYKTRFLDYYGKKTTVILLRRHALTII